MLAVQGDGGDGMAGLPGHGARHSRRDAGRLESEVLSALWASTSPLSPGEVQKALGDGLAYTTVMTTLTRLYEKGLVARERVGRAYAYQPVAEEAGHLAARMRALLETGHDRAAVLSRFVDELSPADSQLLTALLRPADRG
jgi:predicted transcriptional regulator